MIDYEGRSETLSAFPETVPVSVLEYRTLVEDAEKGRVMADGILSAMRTSDSVYPFERDSLDERVVLAVFKAVYPDDYNFWLKDQKKQAEEAKKVADENDIL